jgi:outer membrane protein assembly factor BamB
MTMFLVILVCFSTLYFPVLIHKAYAHNITDPWVHQRITKKALEVWNDCPPEIKNHAQAPIDAFLPLPCMVSPWPGYDNEHDIIIGSGEEDREKNPFCNFGTDPVLRCGGDNEGRNGFMEHFWDPDQLYGNNYNCEIGETRYNKGLFIDDALVIDFPPTQYDSAYRLAQDYWDGKVIRFYREGKELKRNGNDVEGDRKINEAYYWLGRVAHLLTDMCVPAHVHLLPHGPDIPIDALDPADCFEHHFDNYDKIKKYMDEPPIGSEYRFEDLPNLRDFNWQEVNNNPSTSNLFRLFWYTAQKTQYFASISRSKEKWAPGNCKFTTLSGEEREFNPSLWDREGVTIISEPLQIPGNEDLLAEALIPHAMKAVAGLYRLFWFEANLIKWKYPINLSQGQQPYFSPTLGKDGTIYVPSGNRLLAINPDGQLKWSFESTGTYICTPSVGRNGNIHFQSSDGVYAVDINSRRLIWKYPTDGSWPGPGIPEIAIDQTMNVYAHNSRGELHAINKSGARNWIATCGVPAITPFGLYTNTGILSKIDGSITPWQVGTIEQNQMPPTVDATGNIYLINGDSHYLFNMNRNGFLNWQGNVGASLNFISPGQAAIDSKGTIYLAVNDYKIAAINPNYEFYPYHMRWEYNCNLYVIGTPAIGNDGIIYVNLYNSLIALSPNGIIRWIIRDHEIGHEIVGSPILGLDGTLYTIAEGNIGDNDWYLYAIRTSSVGTGLLASSWPTNTTGPAKSSWPMFGANSQHTFLTNIKISFPFLHLLMGH